MILVTGGSGHLGANLIRALLGRGEKVRALVREGSDNRALDGLAIERVAGDLRDATALARAVKGCTRVFHCAARISTVGGGEREIWDTNVLGTKRLLDAARAAKVERVVVTGSFSAVGHERGRPSDETMPFYPFDAFMPYEWTKALVELECARACFAGLPVVVATSCAIVGPNDWKPSRVGRALLDFGAARMPAYVGGGFEFVTTHDIALGHLLAMERGRPGEKYLFSTAFRTIDDLLVTFERTTGARRPRLGLPAPLMYGIARVTSPLLTRFAPNVPQRFTPAAIKLLAAGWRADTSKAERELGFVPSGPLGVDRAIEEAWSDFVRRGVARARAGSRPLPSEPVASAIAARVEARS